MGFEIINQIYSKHLRSKTAQIVGALYKLNDLGSNAMTLYVVNENRKLVGTPLLTES